LNGENKADRTLLSCRAIPVVEKRSNAARRLLRAAVHLIMLNYLLSAACCLLCLTSLAKAEDDITLREEAALKVAVDRIAPSVVRIETLGGLESVGEVLVGTGPTTGLIVSSEGYIVSSAFNFANKPAQILVDLADGTRLPAKVVAHDTSRMLVLLKVPTEGLDVKKQLPVPEAAPLSEMRVGQWSIAIGRVFDAGKTNISIGILSALNRVWGKAVQTDAKISPANYGGPLIDLHGRVIGVLVPMSPMETGEMAGVEWYDSGIGFAVPLEQINRVLDRLKKGEDLSPGLIGVSLRAGDPYATEPVIAACHPKSPAAEAGIKTGDKIVAIDGVPVASQSEMKHQLGPRYAGEKVVLTVLRGKERLEKSTELVAKLLPYVHPFLGVLPMRDNDAVEGDKGATESKPAGVIVREVYPDSPAAKAGIKSGDRIVSLDGQPIVDRARLQEKIAAFEPLKAVKVELERGGQAQTSEVKLATLPEAVPAALPPARDSKQPADENPPATGKVEIKIPEAPNGCIAYVPETYNTHVSYGLVVWLHASGGFKDDELLKAWKPICEANDLILLAPKSADKDRWQRTEFEFIRKAIDDVAQKYNIDKSRVIVAGRDLGGAMAYFLAAQNRDLIRGVAAINAPLPPTMRVPANDPVQRLAFFTTVSKKSSPLVAMGIKRLRDAKFPVTQLDIGDAPRDLNADEMSQLARWVDSLDRS
jgi:serine protease Do